jgi:lysozyme
MDPSLALSIATNLIAGEEGFSSSPYFDSNGYAIGYGNHYYEDGSLVSADDDPIDSTRGLELLSFYVNQNLQALLSQVTAPLNENQFAALTSIRYNCGTITNGLLNLINSGADIPTVQGQIMQTCMTSGGQPSAAITSRRQGEAALYGTSVGGLSGSTLAIIAGIGLLFVGYLILSGNKR